MDFANLFTVALGAILVNNFIVAQFLGICPFMGVSKKVETASGMGIACLLYTSNMTSSRRMERSGLSSCTE